MKRAGRPRSFDRAQALEQAMEVFWRYGYRDASIDQLTRAMGITPPSLYAAFSCKAALFVEAAELYERTDGASAADALATGSTARIAVEQMLLANALLFTRSDRPPGCLFTRAALTCPTDEPAVGDYLASARRERIANLRRALRAGEARGEAIPFGPAEGAAFYDTVVQGMAVRAAEGVSRRALRRTARRAIEIWDAHARPSGGG